MSLNPNSFEMAVFNALIGRPGRRRDVLATLQRKKVQVKNAEKVGATLRRLKEKGLVAVAGGRWYTA